jgi:hypothetical protein
MRTIQAISAGGAALAAVALLASSPAAQSREHATTRTVRAIRVGSEGPRIDGRLDDPEWRTAAFVSDFVQKDPDEGKPASETTQVGLLYDDDAIYIGARMHCNRPKDHIRASMSRRDNVGNSERFIVSLDTYRDRRTCYSFAVTATGVIADYYHPIDNEYQRDYSWDPVWHAHTSIDSAGWSAEIRIPFSQLRFRSEDVQVWGINYNRYVSSESEDAFLVYVPKNVVGWSSYFPDLVGIEGIRPSRRLEVVPYVASDGRFDEAVAADPFHDGSDIDTRAGGDLKLGLGPNLTLDATINPDFGQVEADPAEVNLTAYETFFSERRPFFTEGSQLLMGNGPGYFYSRRIGAAPHRSIGTGEEVMGTETGDPLRADFFDTPDNSTILGAAKITGRLNSGLSVGALSAVTSREWAVVADTTLGDEDSATLGKTLMEPTTFYAVSRVQQEFGRSASTVGVTLTGVRRDLEAPSIENLMNRSAVTGGADWNLRLAGGRYSLGGSAGFSHLEGTASAVAIQQLSSRRYYQRPDADYVEYDPQRTSLSGYQAGLNFSKNDGRRWIWDFGGNLESPGFELNDMGRLSSADDIDTWGSVTYRVTEPGKLFRNHSSRLGTNHGWDFGGAPQYRNLVFDFNSQLRNFMSPWAGFELWGRAKDDALTRGGPLMGTGGGASVWAGFNANHAANLYWSLSGSLSRNELKGWGIGMDGELRVRTGGRWEIRVNPHFERTRPVRQYITTRDRLEDDDRTFGRRYIFSYIDRSTISTQVRLNYSFSPDFTLELYAEPFASSGRYSRFGELAAAGTRDILYYGDEGTTFEAIDAEAGRYQVGDGDDTFEIRRPDFNVLSFRSNLVLRWQWRPGSTLFLVWQQNRAEDDASGRMVRPGRLLDSFTAQGENFLAAKVTYWIPVK